MERQIRLAMQPGSMTLIASFIAGKGIEQLWGERSLQRFPPFQNLIPSHPGRCR